MKDYYEILEVNRKASKDTINKVFKMHMKANHPDLFQGEEKIKAEAKSKELTEAYNILSDDNARLKYDQELQEAESGGSSTDIQKLIEENEYLKDLVAQKDEYIVQIAAYMPEDLFNKYVTDQMYQNQRMENTNPNYNQNVYDDPNMQRYADMSDEELRKAEKQDTWDFYMEEFKDSIIKIGFSAILVLLAIFVFWSALSNLFKDDEPTNTVTNTIEQTTPYTNNYNYNTNNNNSYNDYNYNNTYDDDDYEQYTKEDVENFLNNLFQ